MTRPVRVLQIVGRMSSGGIERWLMHVLRSTDRSQLQMHFATLVSEHSAFEEEIRALGGRVFPCPVLNRPWSAAHRFRRILEEHGPYDVVHSHVGLFSGWPLRLAARMGVPMRIAHGHSDFTRRPSKGVFRRLCKQVTKRWIMRYATDGLAASRAAGSSFYTGWGTDPRWRVLFCGVDLAPFKEETDRRATRRELGIPEDALVVGNVARFSQVKNQQFVVDVAAAVARSVPNLRVLLVGDGPLRGGVEDHVRRLGMEDRVVFTGERSDVPRLMLGAMDAIVFPSSYEGLGLVLIEAQAAGKPCLISDVVPEEADVVPGLVRRMSLSAPAGEWAIALLEHIQSADRRSPEEALTTVIRSPFNIENSVRELTEVFLRAVERRKAA